MASSTLYTPPLPAEPRSASEIWSSEREEPDCARHSTSLRAASLLTYDTMSAIVLAEASEARSSAIALSLPAASIDLARASTKKSASSVVMWVAPRSLPAKVAGSTTGCTLADDRSAAATASDTKQFDAPIASSRSSASRARASPSGCAASLRKPSRTCWLSRGERPLDMAYGDWQARSSCLYTDRNSDILSPNGGKEDLFSFFF
mmetsp:Transcript_13315/g.41959  ORF Transcript_13315/g.41959 Transcript_13315/m.41959 type:complete len:205 (+) Transcript_13315:975-1589(+)